MILVFEIGLIIYCVLSAILVVLAAKRAVAITRRYRKREETETRRSNANEDDKFNCDRSQCKS